MRHVGQLANMVRPGIHFPETFITLVLRNGATVRVSSILNMSHPKFLDKVCTPLQCDNVQGPRRGQAARPSYIHGWALQWWGTCDIRLSGLQDPTNHPAWTGKVVTEIKDESRAAKFIAKFGHLHGFAGPESGGKR